MPQYGNWIRKRILLVFLSIGVILLALAILPPNLPLLLRIALLIPAGLFLAGFAYFTYAYVQFSARGGDLQAVLREFVLDQLAWDGTGQALDIGTGNGPLAIRLAKKYPQARVTGIDFWGKAWEYSQAACIHNAEIEGVADRVTFRQASASHLPFEEGAFDVAVSHFVFHEVADTADKREVIREALRVVRPGGEFCFQDMFFDAKVYGAPEDLLAVIRGWGIAEVRIIDTRARVRIPRLLRPRQMLGSMGILYGKR